MPLLTADISSHNTILNWGTFLGSVDALICKITEGVGYRWTGAPNALAQGRNAGKLIGAYHFASAGDPVAEADYFLANYAHQPGEVIVLDWEPVGYTGDRDAWCAAWCSEIIAKTGVVPWVYMNGPAARGSSWAKTRALGCGLWIAAYGTNTGAVPATPPAVGSWGSYAAWQYTSNGSRPGMAGVVDLSQFYGSPDQWRAYGTPGGTDMPMTPADAELLWSFVINGVQARDRLNGMDSIQLPGIAKAIAALPSGQATPMDPVAFAEALVANPQALTAFAQALAPELAKAIGTNLANG